MLRSYLFPYFANPSCVFVFAVSALSCGAEPLRDELEPFLEENCFDCHDDETSEGGLSLLDLEFAPGRAENFKIWERVFDRIGSDEMPPKNKPRPDAAAKAVVLEKLEAPLLAADREDKAARGRVNMRGLTRREYEHTVHDLLGVDLPLQELLPEDPATHGFETVASGQQLSHFNLASYLEAADLALDEAFGRAIRGDREFKRSIEAAMLGKAGAGRGNFRGPETRDGQSIAWPIRIQFYGRMPATRVPESGWYRITLTDVQAVNAVSGSAWGTLRSGACASNEPMLYPVGIVEATAERRDLSYSAWIREGHMLELKPNDSTRKSAPTGATGGNVSYKGRDLKEAGFEGIAISGIEIERIYPNAERWQIRKLLLGDLSKEDAMALMATSGTAPRALLERAIRQFASRAFRRPVSDQQIAPYVELALAELRGAGRRPADGLHAAYRAILCSPRFLTFIENIGSLDNHAIASRLSYMLWNSMPDAELRELADRGKLLDYKVRHAQVERLLADPKSERFIASFSDQWLNLKEIEFTSPDRQLYPSFDPIVQESMLAETRGFLSELLRDDAPITNLIQSDFAMLNERLARFYGMGGLALEPGRGLQRVSLGDNSRGGLVTQGSVLKVTANGTTTSPVVRGVWVGERILGMHIPPPPANVPAIEPDIRGAVSIRDQLDKHRNSASCAACHVKIDPAGFALESFDPVGLWRTKYGKKKNAAKVDPSGVTPEGDEFAGINEWKAIYLKRPDELTENFAKQLLTYATGAEPRFSDRLDIAEIVDQARKKGYGVKWILHAVVASEAFHNK